MINKQKKTQCPLLKPQAYPLTAKLKLNITALGPTTAHASTFFSRLMQAFEGAGEITQRKHNGITANLNLDYISVVASPPRGPDAANSPLELLRALCDARTLSCVGAYTSSAWRTPTTERRSCSKVKSS